MAELVRLAGEAKLVLENAAFKAALAGTKDLYVAKIKACRPRDDVERRVYAEILNFADTFEAHLRALLDGGTQEAVQAEAYEPQPEETRFFNWRTRRAS